MSKCYSLDEETFTKDWESLWEYDDPIIGATYWEADAVPDTHEKNLSWSTIQGVLENLDENLACKHGDYFDICYLDVTNEEIEELRQLFLAWANKHVKLHYFQVKNVVEKVVTQDDI